MTLLDGAFRSFLCASRRPHTLLLACLLMVDATVLRGQEMKSNSAGAPPLPPRLKVGSELDYPPFALVGENNQATGFTVELWNMVAREAGLQSEVITGPFHEILAGFKTNQIDVLINLAQSDERRTFCQFSVPHVTMHGAIFVPKDSKSIRTATDLRNKNLIVLNRDLAHDYAIGQGWTNRLVLVNDSAAAFDLLATGQHDAVLIGKLVGLNTLRQKNIKNIHPLDIQLGFQQKFAFAVKRDRPGSVDLMDRINEGLSLVKANGAYDALYEKWFGVIEPRQITWQQILNYVVPILFILVLTFAGYVIEHRLRKNLNRTVSLLNATLEATEDGILALDGQDRISAHNQKLVDLGIYPDMPTNRPLNNGQAIFDRLASNAQDPEPFLASIASTRRIQSGESFDTLHLTDGRCFEIASKPQRVDGLNYGRVWSFRDVTRREKASLQIRQFNSELEKRVQDRTRDLEDAGRQLKRLSSVATRTRNSVIICDPQGRIEWINESFKRIFGYDLAEITGRHPHDFLCGPETNSEVLLSAQQALNQNKTAQYTLLYYTKSGTPAWIETEATFVVDPEGHPLSLIFLQVDITDRRLAEDRLQQQRAELSELNMHLEAALRSRDGFVAAMSHELRTPLHGILGLAEIMQESPSGKVSAKHPLHLQHIQQCANHLLELINDILDYTKMQSTGPKLELEDCSVETICRSSLALIQSSAQRKQQRIELSISTPNLHLRADGRRLKQTLVNLLSNAVKFTAAKGHIGLHVELVGSEVHFKVTDTGVGIAPEDLPKLFQPFVQLDNSLSRQHGGTGLGLSLVLQTIEAHSGRIEVSSQLNIGSQFAAIFPLIPPQPSSAAPSNASVATTHTVDIAATPVSRNQGIRVLVAEDNPVNLSTILSYLEDHGVQVISAETGTQAVALAESWAPDAILMDIQMPQMDGLEATKRIRRSPVANLSKIPIIAMTALAMPGDRERCLAAGCSEYLPKPIPLKTVMNHITRLMVAAAPAGQHAPASEHLRVSRPSSRN